MPARERSGFVLNTASLALFAAAAVAFTHPAMATDYNVPSGTTDSDGVELQNGDTLTNSGTVTNAAGDLAVSSPAGVTVTSITNNAGASIIGNGAHAVRLGTRNAPWDVGGEANIGSFTNYGTITATSSLNDNGTPSDPGDDFYNLGTGFGVWITGDANSFANYGTIYSDQEIGVLFSGSVTNLLNNGTIRGGWGGLAIDGTGPVNFINNGTITANTDLDGPQNGMWITNGVLTNTGLIKGEAGVTAHGYATGSGLTVINSGKIDSTQGVAVNFNFLEPHCNSTTNTVANSIVYTGPDEPGCRPINPHTNEPSNASRNNTLQLLQGSTLIGQVIFGTGTQELLDLQQYVTSTDLLLPVTGLDNVKLADGSTVSFSALTSQQVGNTVYQHIDSLGTDSGTVHVFNVAGAGGGGGGGAATTASVTTEISNVVASQIGDISGSFAGTLGADTGTGGETAGGTGGTASFYDEPGKPTKSQLAAAELAGLNKLTHKSWVSGFGGVSSSQTGTPFNAMFGGIIGGKQADASSNTTLGAFAGYVRTNLDVGTSQRLGINSAVAGAYGQTSGALALDYSLIGGLNFNHSDRDVIGGSGIETAKADYLGWFLVPELGLTLPVIKGDAGTLNFAVRGKYVGGSIGGYTETGSSANQTVGSQPLSLAEGRLEVNGTRNVGQVAAGAMSFFGKAGVYAQTNFGGTSVPVTVFGSTFTSVTPGTVVYGVYGGGGIKVRTSDTSSVSMSLNTYGQSNGVMSASGKLQFLMQY
ncbi:MAG TPA: autotransporter outer membrane beta-barrel domain-containing protein [Bauldia sp.]|nr:autotransporter outer membrane beta-barrel domain-containing protein [Bauldia sp.]